MPSDGIGVASSVAWPPAQPYQEPPDDGKPHIWAQKGFQFHDFLDIINPLQRMLDALDKYADLQRQRNGPGGARGTRIDLSP